MDKNLVKNFIESARLAEKLKNEIGSLDEGDGLSAIVSGRNVLTGEVKTMTVRAGDILLPIKAYFDRIAKLTQSIIKKLPPETASEIRRSGVYVSGKNSSVYGLERYFSDKLGFKVSIAKDGLYSVVLGGGIAIGDKEILKKVSIEY